MRGDEQTVNPTPHSPESGPLRTDPREPDAVLIAIKAVPGASRDQVAGLLGDRIKVRVAAPPEGGKANEAICKLIAETLDVPARQVEIVAGHARAEKTLRVSGTTVSVAKAALLA